MDEWSVDIGRLEIGPFGSINVRMENKSRDASSSDVGELETGPYSMER